MVIDTPGLDRALLDRLAERSREHPVAALSGLVRFDVVEKGEVDHWYLECARGVVTVSRTSGKPDCVLRGDRTVLEAVLSGNDSPMPALLRGALEVEGNVFLLLALRQYFPQEYRERDQPAAGYAKRQS